MMRAARLLASALLDGLTLVAAKGGLGLFAAMQDFDGTALGLGSDATSPPPRWRAERAASAATPQCARRTLALNEARRRASGNLFDNTRSYLMWALSGKRARLGLDGAAEKLDSTALASTAAWAMAGWAKGFRDLVDLSDPTTISCLPIRTSLPVAPWPTGRITLIGDAIHSMTPYRGIGANIALRDALHLRDALVAAQRNEVPLLDAIASYETAMRDYGFQAVRNSLQAMQQTTGQGPIAMALSRSAFRLVNHLPPLKRRMVRGMGEE